MTNARVPLILCRMSSNPTIPTSGWLQHARRPAFIAMIHVQALPGTPRNAQSIAEIARLATEEARMLADCGVDAIILENMHDTPYLRQRVGPEIVAAMTAVTAQVRAAVSLPLGVQVLAGANRAAISIALATGAQFIRAENYVFAHVADEGLMPQADAGPLLRFRRRIAADAIEVFADIKKKHSAHSITADVDLAETARAAEFFGASGVIVTGSATGQPTAESDVALVRQSVGIPVLVGSGTTPRNLPDLAPHVHGFIIGSWLKHDGAWFNPLDLKRVQEMSAAFQKLGRS